MLRDAKPPFSRPTDRVFEITPTLKAFRRDLERAGIPLADDNSRTLDLHALKTTFVNRLAAYAVNEAAKRKPAQHSLRGVTRPHRLDSSVLDLWSEIARLPAIRAAQGVQIVRVTGTDSATGVVLPVVGQPGREG